MTNSGLLIIIGLPVSIIIFWLKVREISNSDAPTRMIPTTKEVNEDDD